MKPEKLKRSDFDKIESALIEFYSERPDIYGLNERLQADYEAYFNRMKPFLRDNSTILDFGTGSWRIVDTIARHGYDNVRGVDYFSDEKLNEYRSKLENSNAELYSMQSGKIPFDDEQFDVVSSLCVVEHLVRVEDFFEEMMRVIKPGGKLIIDCPNWSSPLVAITGMKEAINGREFWQFENFWDAFSYFFRSLLWYTGDLISNNDFNLVYPKMKNGKIDFSKSDDDAVHLCNPLRLKKYFRNKGHKLLFYNRGVGTTKFTYLFNRIFPSLASTNFLVVEKTV